MIVKTTHSGCPFLTALDKLEAARLMDEAVVAAEKDGAQFAARVRRERLSVDHMMILNFNALKKVAADHGYAWTRPATRAEALKKWISEVKALGVTARCETVNPAELEMYFNRLRRLKN
jgi:hypothetical protein